jgi:hypothetical protein
MCLHSTRYVGRYDCTEQIRVHDIHCGEWIKFYYDQLNLNGSSARYT